MNLFKIVTMARTKKYSYSIQKIRNYKYLISQQFSVNAKLVWDNYRSYNREFV